MATKAKSTKKGRPSKLTPELHTAIIAMLEKGNYRQVAARYVGINPSTLRDWVQQGKNKPQGEYGAFAAAVIEAEGKAEKSLVDRLYDLAQSDGDLILKILERRYPDRWAKLDSTILRMIKQFIETMNGKLGGNGPQSIADATGQGKTGDKPEAIEDVL